MTNQYDDAHLDEFDKTEWFDVCRIIKPDLTEEEYTEMWNDFQLRKEEWIRKSKLQ